MKTPSKTLKAALVAVVVAGTLIASIVGPAGAQSQPYVGEIMTFGDNFCPVGWVIANGQLLPISAYFELFALIGTTFGGDGQNTFGVPNLNGATVVGTGQGTGLPPTALGQTGGNTNTVIGQTATAKAVQVPATQSPFVGLTQCMSLFGVFPSTD